MSFGPVHALTDVHLTVNRGECIGLVGHNGAGKSTLVNVINGRLTPGKGQVIYDDDAHSKAARNALQARDSGIRSVFQELSLCPNLTVLENFRISYKSMPGASWRKRAREAMRACLDRVFPGHGIDPRAMLGALTIAQRQMVEIAIAFSRRDMDANLVILDEPTSSLDATIASQLLDYARHFCARGGAIIFISHMLGEIFEIADRIVVMKDGKIVEDEPAARFTHERLVETMGHMTAEGEPTLRARESLRFGPEVVRMQNGLTAREGEIVGLAGLAGHGQAASLARFFMEKSSVWKAKKNPEVAFVAGDRTRDGIMPMWSIMRNLSLKTLVEFGKIGLIDINAERKLAEDWRERIEIRTDDVRNPILSLSGGNQQKVLFAKALASCAPIVVMDDPMRGVDVGTKKEVYGMIRTEAAKGRTFLWYSTETDEILKCDRVFVFRDGAISAELIGDAITEENMLRASFGMYGNAR
ncbi:MAG: sugar ABC transporter ATP-binding protein [Pseudomonadota bacterium]